jgi:hypothetical protein
MFVSGMPSIMAIDKRAIADMIPGPTPAINLVPPMKSYEPAANIRIPFGGSKVDVLAFNPRAARQRIRPSQPHSQHIRSQSNTKRPSRCKESRTARKSGALIARTRTVTRPIGVLPSNSVPCHEKWSCHRSRRGWKIFTNSPSKGSRPARLGLCADCSSNKPMPNCSIPQNPRAGVE